MRKILIVEETRGAARRFAEALLQEKRWDVHTAEAGAPALCRAHDLRPDLLIADVAPQEGEGLRTVRTLGWIDAVPSVLLSDIPGPSLDGLPNARLVLHRSCDRETLVRTVDDLLPPR